MPTVLLIAGIRFYFFSGDGNEPPHIHVKKNNAIGKIWLSELTEEYMYGFTVTERRQVKEIVEEHKAYLITKWNEHFK